MTKPIRVLHVFGRLESGGAESRTMDIYRNIDREKVQFDFAIHTEDECFYSAEVRALGGNIYSFPRFNGKNIMKYKKSWSTFFEQHPEYEIVHGHLTSAAFLYLNEAKKYKVPVRIAHARNSNKDNIIKKYTSKLSRFYTTHLFAVSRLAAISEFGEKKVNEGKVSILPNAIDAGKYKFDENKRLRKREEFGFKDKLVVCHVGRLHPQKNHEFLLEIFEIIKTKHKNSILLLVGEGPLKEKIEKQIQELSLEDSVILTGARTDVPDILQASDVLLFPSHFEGLPGVVLEAQAAGLPSVISNNITKEVKITDLVKYISLNEGASYWATKTLEHSKKFSRYDTFNEIKTAGYDINTVSKWYEEFYLSVTGEEKAIEGVTQ